MSDPHVRSELAKLGRLWLLALLCASAGTAVLTRSGSLWAGACAFLAALAVLGPLLLGYERRLRRGRTPPGPKPVSPPTP